jgi:hypothetical protein
VTKEKIDKLDSKLLCFKGQNQKSKFLFKKDNKSQAHTYNPSYLGGWDRED